MRLRPADVLLLALVVPFWAALVAFQVGQVAAGRPTVFPPMMHVAPGADGHPVVDWVHPSWVGGRALRPGDVLLRAGTTDLAGTSYAHVATALVSEARDAMPVPVAIRRADATLELPLDVGRSHPFAVAPVWTVLTTIAFVATGVLILVRARDRRAARTVFVALVGSQFYFSPYFPGPPWQTGVVAFGRLASSMLAGPCLLQSMMLLVPETVPTTFGAYWWPWLLAPLTLAVHTSVWLDIPFRSELALRWVDPIGWTVFATGMVAIVVHGFRAAGPLGRRRIKWVVYGGSLLYVPRAVQSVLFLLGYDVSFDWTFFALTAIVMPACIVVAVVRENLLDIDRVISVTASYTLLAAVGIGLVLVGLPRVAAAASGELGLDPSTGQLALALLFAGVAAPAHRRLRPQIDRIFFRERWALERGVASLLRALSETAAPDALYATVGARLDALVQPVACVVYARTGDAFSAAFARGRVGPPAFEGDGPLIAAIARRTSPLVATARRGDGDVGPFDRAALETLDAAVVLGVRRGRDLVAFVCLGEKRSGDVYTPTDVALLDAVARKVSDELTRFDLADVVERARVMEGALRRYVPAAITAQLDGGRRIEPAEREVSVLFVDIRGYTSFAERRQAAEVFSVVNRFAERASAIAHEHGGVVVEFSGDGMMIVFGAPEPLAAKERAAVETARRIVDAVRALPTDEAGASALAVGAGIATGVAFVGDVRSSERWIWTAIGDTVNLAARLQQLTRTLDAAIAIDGTTRRAAADVAGDFVRRDAVAIRGRSAPETVWLLPSTASPDRKALAQPG